MIDNKKQNFSEWDNLYEFVRSKVMEYDANQSLSKFMVLRLKGLATNKFMENKKVKDTAHYSYTVILNTFKCCMPDIEKAKHTKIFHDEKHKFNYILCMVEEKINDIYERMQKIEKTKEKLDNAKTEIIEYKNSACYQSKTNVKNDLKFKDMW